jgi:hypothetical protein
MANHFLNFHTKKALMLRIVHPDNLPWILNNRVHCEHDVECKKEFV